MGTGELFNITIYVMSALFIGCLVLAGLFTLILSSLEDENEGLFEDQFDTEALEEWRMPS